MRQHESPFYTKDLFFYFISFLIFFGYQPRGTGPHETAYTCKGVSLLAIEPWAEGWGRNTQPPRYHYDFIYKRFVTRRIKETKSNSLQQTETILSSYLNRNYPISIKDYNLQQLSRTIWFMDHWIRPMIPFAWHNYKAQMGPNYVSFAKFAVLIHRGEQEFDQSHMEIINRNEGGGMGEIEKRWNILANLMRSTGKGVLMSELLGYGTRLVGGDKPAR